MTKAELQKATYRARAELNIEGIPAELKALPSWVCWRFDERKGKLTKVPINPRTGGNAAANTPDTWTPFETAFKRLQGDESLAGLGFVFSGDGDMGIDIDHCIDAEGNASPAALEAVKSFATYTEYSISGTGLHILCRARLPEHRGRKREPFELYSKSHFFVMSGNRWPGTPGTIEPRQEQVDQLLARLFPQEREKEPESRAHSTLNDETLIQRARSAKNGENFAALWAGQWQGRYSSQSEADAALLSMLRFWTSGDKAQAFHLFGQSGLNRDKWQRDDYRESTWQTVNHGETYSPSSGPEYYGRDTTPESVELQARLFQIAQTRGLTPSERNQRMAAATLDHLHRRGRFFYHADFRDYETAMFFDGHRRLLLRLESDEFQSWLSGYLGINRIDRPFAFVYAAIQDEALSGKTTGLIPEAYWAARAGAIYLSNGDGQAVKVKADRIDVVDNGTDDVLFAAGRTLRPWTLTDPQDPFETCRLFRDMNTTAPHGKDLLRLWTLALPTNQRCKPPLVISGGIGSGKTRTATGVFELYGLPARVTALCETGETDFWTAMDAGGLCCFDNADTRIKWLPDALAAAATDGTHEKRRLYTDSGIVQQRARSWIVVTSANATFASDAGLADRLLVVRLDRRDKDTAESALADEIAANRNAGLSFIASALSKALADSAPVRANLNRRHPDFAGLAVRLGRAIGRETEAVKALEAAEIDKSLFNLQNDDLGTGLLALMDSQESFFGTAFDLLEALRLVDASFSDPFWNAKRVSKRLSKLFPHVQAAFKARQVCDGHSKTIRFHFQRCGYCGY